MKRSRTSGWLFLLSLLFFLLFLLLLLLVFLSDRWPTRLQISISVKVSGSWLDSDRVQMARSDENKTSWFPRVCEPTFKSRAVIRAID